MKIEHIAMYVNDLESVRDFSLNTLALYVMTVIITQKQVFDRYFFVDDGARLEIMNKPQMEDEVKSPVRTGYIHIAFSVGSKEKVDFLTRQMQEDGYEVVSGPRTTGDRVLRKLYYRDMKGNQIEINSLTKYFLKR